MKCPKCGYANKEGAGSCNLCGALLRRADGRPASGQSATRPPQSDDIFPTPSALSIDPNAPSAPSFIDSLDARDVEASRKARLWFVGGGALIVVAIGAYILTRLPYSASTVDAMYERYTAEHPRSSFPAHFFEYQARREESVDTIFQVAHAYEQAFVEQSPYAAVQEQTETRLTSVKAGQSDPGLDQEPSFTATNQDAIERTNNAETVTKNIYGAGSKPFDTLRSLAGGDEQGRERRQLEMEYVHGEKETRLQSIEMDRANRINHYRNLEKKVRDELEYFMENGTPKLRSIARRMNERLFPDESAP